MLTKLITKVLKSSGNRILISCLCTVVVMLSTIQIFPAHQFPKQAGLIDLESHMLERIPGIMETYQIPGVSIVVIKDKKIAWSKAFGYADLSTGTPMTIDTPLRVQSISKSITAWGVMKLVEDGLIDVDAPVNQYLKSWSFPPSNIEANQVTIRQLLTHTAGFPVGDFYNFYSPLDKVPPLRNSLFQEAVLFQEPGKSFYYSNIGYNLLELIIEDVTGLDFNQYMQTQILSPLGMQASTFTWSIELIPPVPTGYDLAGNPIPVYVYPEKSSGGLFATVEDLAHFVIASMPDEAASNNVISYESIQTLHSLMVDQIGLYNLVFDGYGFGHYIETLSNGNTAISHGGQGTGWMTHFHAIPESGDGIVILTNSQRSWPLIAYILTGWARWAGLPTLGMSRIILGIYLFWLLIGLLWFTNFMLIINRLDAAARKKLAFPSLQELFQMKQLIKIVLSISIFSGLLWAANQKYLFVTSVFPIAARWFGVALFFFAVTILLLVFLQIKENHYQYTQRISK